MTNSDNYAELVNCAVKSESIVTITNLITTRLHQELYRIYQRCMMRTPNGDRIIDRHKNPAQSLSGVSTSYVPLGVMGPLSIDGLDGVNLIGGEQVGTLIGMAVILLGATFQTGFDSFENGNPEPSGSAGKSDADEEDEPVDETDSEDTETYAESDEGESDSETQETDNSEDNDDEDDSEKIGVIYTRVSQDDQDSIPTQIDNMEEIAEERGIECPFEPKTDKGETGQNFEREGIQTVFHLAMDGEITHVLVDDVSRIGRNAPQTIYFVHLLQQSCNVKIITAMGELDTSKVHDLLDATLQALVSHMSALERGRKARDTKVRRFTKEKNWMSWYRTVPLGYSETSDGWIEPDPIEKQIVEKMFDYFHRTGSYTETKEYLKSRDCVDLNLSRQQVKQCLQRPVYIGMPSIVAEPENPEDGEGVVHDEDVRIVSDERFAQVQEIIRENREKYSGDNESKDVDDFVDMFGVLPVLESSDDIVLRCPRCEGEMVKNGNRTLRAALVHNYKCKECGRQRKFPLDAELEVMLDMIRDLLDDPNV